jgi:hypothetical protein
LHEEFATAQIDEMGILTRPDQDDALSLKMRGDEKLSSALATVKNGKHTGGRSKPTPYGCKTTIRIYVGAEAPTP